MIVKLAIDRFEEEIAVLINNDGKTINFPRDLLPKDAKAGQVIILSVEQNEQILTETREIQSELKKRDPGGDVVL